MKLLDTKSVLAIELERTLDLKEAQLDDNTIVTNKEAICQLLIERALQGDLNTIDLIARLTK